jgi:hypothetical protein
MLQTMRFTQRIVELRDIMKSVMSWSFLRRPGMVKVCLASEGDENSLNSARTRGGVFEVV